MRILKAMEHELQWPDHFSAEDLDRLEKEMSERPPAQDLYFYIGSVRYTYAELRELAEKYFPDLIAPANSEEPVMINGYLWDKVVYVEDGDAEKDT